MSLFQKQDIWIQFPEFGNLRKKEVIAMPILTDYQQFNGRHPETGSVHNILAYQDVTAPHTRQPYTEAFLLGVSGGITFGYFTFDYQGYDPILALLMRNTFDPLQTMLARLGIRQTVLQTNKPETGEKNLMEALANSRPALVWADRFSLPYNEMPPDERIGICSRWWCMGWRMGSLPGRPRLQPLMVPAEALAALER
jgi:hypothetical protein